MGKYRKTRIGSKFVHLWSRSAAASSAGKASSPRRLSLESLEDRLVLSTVLPFSQLGVTSSGNFPGGEATDAFDGTGMVSADLHNNLWNEGWLSNGGTPAGEWLKVELGGTYDIDYLRVWNDNQASLTARGIKQADIYVAFSDPGDNLNNSSQPFDPTHWTLVVADHQFTKSPGGASIVNTDPQISLSGVQAAFLAIRIDSSWGDPEFVGLSEMQIYVDDGNITTFPLVVNNGSGGGVYVQGANVAVAANLAPLGQVFDAWTGDTGFLTDALDPTTTFTMPAAAAIIAASYRNLPSGDAETWQIDFEATEPTHPSLFSITSVWDVGFGSTWNTYTNPMRNGATVPPQSGHTESNLLDATGNASAVDFSLVSGTTLGMIAGYAGAGIENTIYSVAREHLFWGGDTSTSDAIGFEFSDLAPGTYDLTFITNAQWHIPHRGFNATVDGQSVDFHPEVGGNEVILNGILSYKEANLDVTLHNIPVDTTGILAGTLTELEAFSDPSLAGIILTQTSTLPTPDPDADFDSDVDVDGSDFLAWQRGFGFDAGSGNVATLASGNANGDQVVDADDLAVWQGQFGQASTINPGLANLSLGKLVTVSGNVNSTGDSSGLLSWLTLESQQQLATDEALVLLEKSLEAVASLGYLSSEPLYSNALGSAFQLLDQQSDEAEVEEIDFDAPLLTSGLDV